MGRQIKDKGIEGTYPPHTLNLKKENTVAGVTFLLFSFSSLASSECTRNCNLARPRKKKTRYAERKVSGNTIWGQEKENTIFSFLASRLSATRVSCE